MAEGKEMRANLCDSDNPILEEFKECITKKQMLMTQNVERIARLETLLAELSERIKSLEKRVEVLEKRG